MVAFDKNGDPSALYDIINWHVGAEGKVEFVKVGQFNGSSGPKQDFQLDLRKVFWGAGFGNEVKMHIERRVLAVSIIPAAKRQNIYTVGQKF